MSKPRLCVGIDVSKEELVVAVEGHSVERSGTTSADFARLSRRLGHLAAGRPLHVGMEATGVYSTRVAAALAQIPNCTVSVINPAQIAAHGRALLKRTKTDAVDARVILDFVVKHQPLAWHPPAAVRQQLYALVTQVETLKAERSQWRNRRHAQQYAVVPRDVTRSTETMLQVLDQQIEALTQAITTLCREDAGLAEDMALLTSVKGIGVASAAQLLAHGGETLTTRSRRQLAAHAGLAPAHRQSGTSVRGASHLAKPGNARLRRSLYMPTLVAVRYNPIFERHYHRLLERGKLKKVALTACMRKLLTLVRALLRTRQPFNPDYQPLT